MNEMGSRWRVRVPRMAGVLPLEEAHGHCRVLSHGRQRMISDPPAAATPRSAAAGVQDARLSPPAGRPAELPVQAPVEPTPAGNTPAAAALPSATAAAAGDVKQPSGPDREATDPEGDSEDAAREWADDRAAWAGSVFIKCHPTGKDWA